jgi:CRISPR-associated endoribonuclease Cas6
LKIVGEKQFPLNYNYPLSAIIYKLLRFGSKDFSSFLHDIGFKLDGKTYKLFSFGIKFNDKVRANRTHLLLSDDKVFLYVTSPLVDDFLKNLVVGSFLNENIPLFTNGTKTLLRIEQIELVPAPIFSDEMKFFPISPIVMGTKVEIGDKLKPYYLRYDDDLDEIKRIFNSNLRNKYELINGSEYLGEDLDFNWDTGFVNERLQRNKYVTKLINNRIRGKIIQIKAIDIPFTLKGNSDLIKIGYESGFGSQNSLGCGLFEVKSYKNIMEDK